MANDPLGERRRGRCAALIAGTFLAIRANRQRGSSRSSASAGPGAALIRARPAAKASFKCARWATMPSSSMRHCHSARVQSFGSAISDGGGELDKRRAPRAVLTQASITKRVRASDRPRAVAQVVSQTRPPPGLPQVHLRRCLSRLGQQHLQLPSSATARSIALLRAPPGSTPGRRPGRARPAMWKPRSVRRTHYHADYVSPFGRRRSPKSRSWEAYLLSLARRVGPTAAFWAVSRRAARSADPFAPPWHTAAGRTGALSETVTAGPAIARAPNDVGGLVDTSKGWTLSIPAR